MKKVLVVDDNYENRYFLKSLLEGSNFGVSLAQHGEEALTLLRGGEFDLIISDILMPVMDGFLFCHQCQADPKFKNIPFIFYTATYTDEMDEDLAVRLGAAAFVKKPVEPFKLIEILSEVFRTAKSKDFAEADADTQAGDILRLYSESLINKLEQKNIALANEVDQRRRTAAALAESEDRHRDLVENSPIMIMTHDLNGKINSVNRTVLKNLGYSPDEIKQINFVPPWGRRAVDFPGTTESPTRSCPSKSRACPCRWTAFPHPLLSFPASPPNNPPPWIIWKKGSITCRPTGIGQPLPQGGLGVEQTGQGQGGGERDRNRGPDVRGRGADQDVELAVLGDPGWWPGCQKAKARKSRWTETVLVSPGCSSTLAKPFSSLSGAPARLAVVDIDLHDLLAPPARQCWSHPQRR